MKKLSIKMCVAAICLASIPMSMARASDLTLSLEDAIMTGLELNSSIKSSKVSLCRALASTQSSQGTFDLNTNASAQHQRNGTPLAPELPGLLGGFTYKDNIIRTETLSFGLSKLFTPGYRISQTFSANTTQSLSGLLSNSPRINTSNIAINLDVPLLKGRDVTSVLDNAFTAEKRSYHSYRLTISSTIRDITRAYWDMVSAQLNLEVEKRSEERARKFFNIMKALVEAKEKPENELTLLEADTISREERISTAERNLLVSKNALGRLLGLSEDAIRRLKVYDDRIPQVNKQVLTDYQHILDFVDDIYTKRDDVINAELGIVTQERTLKSQILDRLPQIDLQFGGGYNYINDRSDIFSSFTHGNSAKQYSAGITYRFPLPNRAARGSVGVTRAGIVDSKISLKEQKRNIKLSIIEAYDALKRSINQLELSQKALGYYQLSLENETLKFNLGQSSLLDILRVRDEVVNGQTRVIRNQVNYAQNLTNFLYEVGDLLEDTPTGFKINIQGVDIVEDQDPLAIKILSRHSN